MNQTQHFIITNEKQPQWLHWYTMNYSPHAKKETWSIQTHKLHSTTINPNQISHFWNSEQKRRRLKTDKDPNFNQNYTKWVFLNSNTIFQASFVNLQSLSQQPNSCFLFKNIVKKQITLLGIKGDTLSLRGRWCWASGLFFLQ